MLDGDVSSKNEFKNSFLLWSILSFRKYETILWIQNLKRKISYVKKVAFSAHLKLTKIGGFESVRNISLVITQTTMVIHHDLYMRGQFDLYDVIDVY